MSEPSEKTQSATPTLADQHPDLQDADRHGRALDAIANLESSALNDLAYASEDEAAAAIRTLAARARAELKRAREVVQVREAQQVELRAGLVTAQETLDNPADCAPELVGREDRERALRDRVARDIRDVLSRVDGPKTVNGI